MIKTIFIFLILFSNLFAYDTLISKSDYKIEMIKQPSFFKADLSAQEAYLKCKNNEFSILPSKAKSSEQDPEVTWFCFEIKNQNEQNLYLSFINISDSKIDFYKYKENKLLNISQEENDYLDRFTPHILLEKNDTPTIYLIRIDSFIPYITSFLILQKDEILIQYLPNILLSCVYFGIFLSLFIYSTIQYFQIKEKAYIFYSLTLLIILILEIIIHGFIEINKALLPLVKVFIFSSAFLFLNLFNFHFYNKNNLKSKLSFWTLFLIFVLFYTFLNIVIDTDNFWLKIFFLFLLIILYFFIINTNIFKNYSPSIPYFIALIGYILGALISYLMYENLLPTNFFFKNAYVFGGIWLMIFLAITLNDIIKKIVLEKNEITLKSKIQEKILFFQSKKLSLGELVGNVTHQWREPLSEVAAIQTNMKASLLLEPNLNKNKLLDLLEQNNSIIQYLSSTIDVFYRILENEDSINSKFNLKKEIDNIQKLVFYIFKTENIRFDCEVDENIFILGDKNEFINALLNIVLNAKDTLIKRKIKNPWIKIKTSSNKNSFKIYIEDNAKGIKQTPVSKIFDFGVSSKKNNIGLGLFITKRIIEERMKGKISVENSINGALFIIEFFNEEYILNNENKSFYELEKSTLERISILEKKVEKQEELENNIKHWENIFNQTYWTVIVFFGTTSNIKMVNPAFHKMYGYLTDEIDKIDIDNLFSRDSKLEFELKKEEAFEKSFSSTEIISIKKDGTTFPVQIDINVIKNENNEILYYVANIKDISEQEKIKNRLHLKQFMINHISEAIFLVDKENKVIFRNLIALENFGDTHNIPNQFGNWNIHWEKIKEKRIFIFESNLVKKDETLFPTEIVANYFLYDDKEYILYLIRDLTNQYKMQEKLTVLQKAIDSSKEAIYVIDDELNIKYINTTSCEMLGYDYEELLSKNMKEIDKHISLEKLKRIREDVEKFGKRTFFTKHKTKYGDILDIEVTITKFTYNDMDLRLSIVKKI